MRYFGSGRFRLLNIVFLLAYQLTFLNAAFDDLRGSPGGFGRNWATMYDAQGSFLSSEHEANNLMRFLRQEITFKDMQMKAAGTTPERKAELQREIDEHEAELKEIKAISRVAHNKSIAQALSHGFTRGLMGNHGRNSNNPVYDAAFALAAHAATPAGQELQIRSKKVWSWLFDRCEGIVGGIAAICGLSSIVSKLDVACWQRRVRDMSATYERLSKIVDGVGAKSTSLKYRDLLKDSSADFADATISSDKKSWDQKKRGELVFFDAALKKIARKKKFIGPAERNQGLADCLEDLELALVGLRAEIVETEYQRDLFSEKKMPIITHYYETIKSILLELELLVDPSSYDPKKLQVDYGRQNNYGWGMGQSSWT